VGVAALAVALSCVFGTAIAEAAVGARASALPDHRLTPGSTMHVGTTKVCRPGYATHVPKASSRRKARAYVRYGVKLSAHAYKVDHLVSVNLGGSNALANLWPQRYAGSWGARKKDRLEKRLRVLVCSGALRLGSARRQIAHNWIAAYKRYVWAPHDKAPRDEAPRDNPPAPPAATVPQVSPTPSPPATTPISPTDHIYWGAYIDGGQYGLGNPPWDMKSVATFEAHAGKSISVLHFGSPWYIDGAAQPFKALPFDLVRAHGSIPLVTWASWDLANGGSATQAAFSLSKIINGSYDAFITAWAAGARAWAHPFFLRFDHEMNGQWYPWDDGQNGNTPGQYVAAWRHVHDIFVSVGATNVTWVWCPNTEHLGSLPLEGLYPGDAYVDWTCMDSYNVGTNPADTDMWRSFSDGVGPTYRHLKALAPTKPVMVGETASTEIGGSKAEWISAALSSLPKQFPGIRALIWFDWSASGHDWPIESSASAQAAFAAGIASPYFAPNQFGAIAQSPIPPP
jgi:hypothetical protein